MTQSHFNNMPNSNDASLMLLAQLSASAESNTLISTQNGTQATMLLDSDAEFPEFDEDMNANAIANANEGSKGMWYGPNSFNVSFTSNYEFIRFSIFENRFPQGEGVLP